MHVLRTFAALLTGCLIALSSPALAQSEATAKSGTSVKVDAFKSGWIMLPQDSTLGFVSVKNDSKVEMNNFATFTGTISETGDVQLRVALDSIDTKIDLRNVRMRFLFFETFKFPEAVVTAHIDPALLSDLMVARHMSLNLPFTLTMHGVSKDMTADMSLTLITKNKVVVSGIGVIPVAADDFGMLPNVTKLDEAAKVKVVPVGSVTFEGIFARNGSPAADGALASATGAAAAKEGQGDLDSAMCKDRFDTLSHAGNISFSTGSAKLDVAGSSALDTLLHVAKRCLAMKIQISGYTDDIGPPADNLALSTRRAAAVMAYLSTRGVDAKRLTATGYGADNPLVPNDTEENRSRNRRIEFKVLE